MNHFSNNEHVEVHNTRGSSSIVIVCEHASAHIPAEFGDLGLSAEALKSHISWDPGAMALARKMAARFDAVLVASKTSRLIYDCNRPPEAPDAMPIRSETLEIPGNIDLTKAQKAQRVAQYYEPFRAALAEVVGRKANPVLVTVHSFTPVFHGKPRDVEIGVLHDSDSRFADALLAVAGKRSRNIVRRNEPYGPKHGVTHTLREHALAAGHLNVMLEVRNDLIPDAPSQEAMAATLSDWVAQALEDMGVSA